MWKMPDFVKSPYFYIEDGQWRLRDDAPKKMKKKLEKLIKRDKELREQGIEV